MGAKSFSPIGQGKTGANCFVDQQHLLRSYYPSLPPATALAAIRVVVAAPNLLGRADATSPPSPTGPSLDHDLVTCNAQARRISHKTNK